MAVAELTTDRDVFSPTTSRDADVSNPVPVMVSDAPGDTTELDNALIAGPPPIRKVSVLVAVVPPTVTLTVPLDAPEGTVATRAVVVALVTDAVVPLNLTVLFSAVVEKPEPLIVTVVPVDPADGVKPSTPRVDTVVRVMAVVLPAAS